MRRRCNIEDLALSQKEVKTLLYLHNKKQGWGFDLEHLYNYVELALGLNFQTLPKGVIDPRLIELSNEEKQFLLYLYNRCKLYDAWEHLYAVQTFIYIKEGVIVKDCELDFVTFKNLRSTDCNSIRFVPTYLTRKEFPCFDAIMVAFVLKMCFPDSCSHYTLSDLIEHTPEGGYKSVTNAHRLYAILFDLQAVPVYIF